MRPRILTTSLGSRAWSRSAEHGLRSTLTGPRQFLAAILHKDLAYKREVMTEHRAEWLAGEFLRTFGKFNSRFVTNSADMPDMFPFCWAPATEFTFDAGIAVMGEAGSGVYWVADED
jgi:hypothetical protein